MPVIFGYLLQNTSFFSGLTNPTDANTYISFMNQAKDGHVLFTNMYTSEEVPYVLFRPTYLIAGLSGLMTGLPNIFVYHLFRIIGILTFIFFLNRLISIYFKDKKERAYTFIVCLFASGFGFLLKLLTLFGLRGFGSVDLWVGDANNFLILLGHPHTIFSIALMAASVYYFLEWNRNLNIKYIVLSAFFTLILGFEHVYSVITLCLAIGVFILIRFFSEKSIEWKKVGHLAIFAAIVSVPIIYNFIVFTKISVFVSWNAQNALETPRIPYVIAGYGLMFVALILTILSKKTETKKEDVWFLVYWILIVFILIYSPFNIQRKFLEGVHIPFGIITGIFLFRLLKPKVSRVADNNKASYLIFLIVIFMILTNIYVYTIMITNLDNGRGYFPYSVNRYLYREEAEALNWLAENSKPDEAILSTYNIGNYIPAYMNRRVYLGHWAQTIDFEKKAKEVNDFYRMEKQISNLDKIKYVWYGVDEKMLNQNFMPPYNLSSIVFQNNLVRIYKIEQL
ncbi:hypothetical protein HYW20_01765 [Candidatus Woesearchaeota archaeon]|nr:hypothetical protein [Candidatus Woesearchaeota archaeon]